MPTRNVWNKDKDFGKADSEAYWKGTKTEHHEATKDGKGRVPESQKPYGVDRVRMGEGGKVVQEAEAAYIYDQVSGEEIGMEPKVTNEFYQMSERESSFIKEGGHEGLVMKDASAYWAGMNPYPVKPTATGGTGPYPAREMGPRAPIKSVRRFASGRPDRFDFFGLFGL